MPDIRNILFINAIDTTSEVENRYPSLGLAYLASSLKAAFGDDRFVCRIISRDVEKQIDEFKPDLVGISAVSQNYNGALTYAATAKKSGAIVVMGGIHISNVPSSASPDMDFIVLGEGESTLCELVRALTAEATDFSAIAGIGYRINGRMVLNESRPRIDPLDSIPFPDRQLIDIQKHTYIFTSRGCPYRCVFCSSSRYWDSVRFFSPEYVVDEIALLVEKYGVDFISIFDDLFVAKIDRVEAIVDGLEKRGLLGRVSFTCSCRANLVNTKVIGLLKRMGVKAISLGLESGNDEILSYLKCGSVSVEDNKNAVKMIRRNGIRASASFVIGSPGETRAQVLDTYTFIKKSPLDLFDVYVITPLPGTPVWNDACARGLASETMDWSRLNVNFGQHPEQAIILSDTLTREELSHLYKKFARLRLVRNSIGILTGHPYARDLHKYLFRKLKEVAHTRISSVKNRS